MKMNKPAVLLLVISLLFTCCNLFAKVDTSWPLLSKTPVVDILSLGADSTGVLDCTTSFVNAVARAKLNEAWLIIPYGHFKLATDSITLDVNTLILGELEGLGNTTLNVGSNVEIIGGTLDGVRLESRNKDNVRIHKVTIKAVSKSGVGLYAVTDSEVIGCNIASVTYDAATTAADGIFLGGCTDVVVEGNTISNFRRIGIVSDSYPGSITAASDNIKILKNTIFNANNSDDSSSEYNAAWWTENTNNVIIEGNICTDICGNPGQTEGRAIGCKVSSCYAPCIQKVVNNVIDDSIIVGNPSGPNYPSIIVEGNVFDGGNRVTIPVSSQNNFAFLSIGNNTFRNYATGTSVLTSSILLGVNISTATMSQAIVDIKGNTFDVTHTEDSAHVMIYGTFAPRALTIENQDNIYIAKVGTSVDTGSRLSIKGGSAYLGTSSGYYALAGYELVDINGCTILGGYLGGGKNTKVKNAVIPADSSIVVPSNSDMTITGSTFVQGVAHYGGATSSLIITDSLFTGVTSSTSGHACFSSNGSSTGTSNDLLRIKGCTFVAPPNIVGDVYAVGTNGNAPSHVILDNNIYDIPNVSNFTDIPTATTSNNIPFDQFDN